MDYGVLFMTRMLLGVLLLQLSFISQHADAGIVLSGTRIVYPGNKQEVTVSLRNTSSHALLIQSWIDTGDPLMMPEKINVPFVIMPPITRINGGGKQSLRIVYTKKQLPEDRESVFWLNVLAVPPKSSDSESYKLNIAYQTRIKLFYRPESLNIDAGTAPSKLQWKKEQNKVSAYNPTPYYISLLSVTDSSKKKDLVAQGKMIAPYGSIIFSREEGEALNRTSRLMYSIIDDSGMVREFISNLN